MTSTTEPVNNMKYRLLGDTGLLVSRFSYGCRKHLIEGTKASLKRLGLDCVDLIFCHRSDPATPLEETVRAMNYIINQGWAYFTGKFKYGLTTWSPLGGGILTGKYSNGIPEGSRMTQWYYNKDDVLEKAKKAAQLEDIAKEVGCTLPQLALAWCAANKDVSTVLFSATSVEQLDENMKVLAFIDKITPEIKAKIDAVVQFQPVLLPQYDAMAIFIRGKHLEQ
ncbi:hypothetical protein Poli38472_007247 [Pythium oligandrum]|uniref:NADP-dependent oxidoreductase domain-containing protein n=1 Tax=Pythium oligandrum TaxID=41045 RepID=A0A8K1FGV5_PYTOL|nr:hypothetical protein Poli38472_007247 [Pythium oligandrum]|eukprot:TMW59102.1 hypothetical protein Poli38472_007247 [Pythium oligandrum]